MIPAPSLISDYSLCFSEDVALDLPSLEGREGEALDRAIEERRRLLDHARNTGDWASITKPGERPTVFVIRPLFGSAFTWMRAECRRREIVNSDGIAEVAFRMAVRDVENFGKWKYASEGGTEYPLLAKAELDAIYSVGRLTADPHIGMRIVLEIGHEVLRRAMDGVRPL